VKSLVKFVDAAITYMKHIFRKKLLHFVGSRTTEAASPVGKELIEILFGNALRYP
jgi:hypothetical protein